MSSRPRVAVVTGGGGGIGGAIAEDLGRGGWYVVTVDPLVTLEGSERLPEPEETTAGRIVAAGGQARASAASVTDRPALEALFGELVDDLGGVDAVVNVAGITRQVGFAHGNEADWRALLEVHLGGYLNVLRAALPVMASAGSGRVVGVTSGSGWRAANAGAYSSAKRVVANLTWQLGRAAPPGVRVNAISPIAATRMVAAAAERARQAGRTGDGGLNLFQSIPPPEALAPLVAHLVDEPMAWCRGQVLFAGGPETAVVGEPRLLEVVRTEPSTSLTGVLEAVLPTAFARSEKSQLSDGGGNPRFGAIFDGPAPSELATGEVQTCAVVTGRPDLARAVTAALDARSITCHPLETAHGFAAAAEALRGLGETAGPLDAVVIAPGSSSDAGPRASEKEEWEQVLSHHDGIVDALHTDGAWARAVADYAAAARRPVRMVTITDATSAGGRSRAQAAAQLARVGAATTEGRVSAFSTSVEAPEEEATVPVSELVAHLLGHPEATALAGAELVVGPGWLGLRSHPRPLGAVTYGGPALPSWLDDVLREIVDVGTWGPVAR